MIPEPTLKQTPLKAVGLISGGLDSVLAAKIVKDLGVDVLGVYFAMPWGCCNKTKAIEAAMQIGIQFIVLHMDERYLELIKNPKYGRGTALNPCIDCRIHMFSRAAHYMRHIAGHFVFTGEVIGQRPMSQRRRSMLQIEEGAGLKGYLLRPLCAHLFEPTIPEREGWIDRGRLLSITGRSRREQIRLAAQLGISGYTQPAGGCLLTDPAFGRRMQDTLEHGWRNFRETVALQWGRHFRLSKDFKAIVGRDQRENDALTHYAHAEDHVMQLAGRAGPTLILQGPEPPMEILQTSAGLVQRFSRFRDEPAMEVHYWKSSRRDEILAVLPKMPDEAQLERMRL